MSCNSSNLLSEHTFFGYWEITGSFLDGTTENLGLNGIRLLLDESGDIIWFNDLFSIQQVLLNDESSSPTVWLSKSMVDSVVDDKSKYSTGNESADILFSCETFEVIDLLSNGPALLFGSYTGHHIEFKTTTFTPNENLFLTCEGWCSITCKRIKDDQSIGQDIQYTLLSALQENFFSDITIKSSDNVPFEVHSPILRLNGFDCSSFINQDQTNQSVTFLNPPSSFSANFLSPPTIHLSTFNFSPNFVNHLSNSFNCLTSNKDSIYLAANHTKNSHTSSSDSNLNILQNSNKNNIFDFHPLAIQKQQQHNFEKKDERKQSLRLSSSQILYKSPLSPFRVRSSPSPFLLDSPLSPLTPISVLFNLNSETLMPILHFLYSESLPHNLNETQLESLLTLCATISPLNKMVGPCKKYLRLIKLKKIIVDILTEIHNCLVRMINLLNPYTASRCPSSLCELFKQCVREIVIGFTLFLQLSQIFSKDTTILNRHQRNEIIKFIKTRFPIFISQIQQLMQNILIIFKSLQKDEKEELVIYLVPEIIFALDVTTDLLADLKDSLESICKDLKKSNTKFDGSENDENFESTNDIMDNVNASSNSIDKDLKVFLHGCEVKKLHDIYGKISSLLEIIQHKQITFKSMQFSEQRNTVNVNMDFFIVEIPTIIERIEDMSRNFDDKFGWKEFKFCFKFVSSHVNGIFAKILQHKATLVFPIIKLCNLVRKSKFNKKLKDLGLLDKQTATQAHLDTSDVVDEEYKTTSNEFKTHKDYTNYKINLCTNLCESPTAINSNLSKNALKLLHSGHLADMEFEVITSVSTTASLKQHNNSIPISIVTNSANNIDNITYSGYTKDNNFTKKEYHIFKAHRVIVASRCEWLKKALLSGMQEDIQRKITIYDTSPVIFRRFLLYLYGAHIDKSGVESICELMLLADRYSVDDLKEVCEKTLISTIDNDTVVCLLGISDRFNANVLKAAAFAYLSQHVDLTKTDMFYELSKDLQKEVFELIQWHAKSWNYDRQYRSRHNLKSPSRPSKSRKSSPSYHK